jgi:hypothetical protein
VVAWNKRFSLLVQSPKQMDNYSVSIGV